MNNKPKVSIIIPVYNVEQWLAKCIDSCIAQTYNNLEIILIDDGSSDSSGEICDNYSRIDERVIVIHQKNQGVSSARNKGIFISTGDYIVFVDSDDWINADMIEELLRYSNYDLVICGYNTILNDTLTRSFFTSADYGSKREILDAISRRMLLSFFQTPWNKLFQSNIIKANRIIYDEKIKYGEDFSFVLKYIEYINKCVITERCLYNFRLSSCNKTKRYSIDDVWYHYRNNSILWNNYCSLFKNTNTYDEVRTRLYTFLIYRIKVSLNDFISHDVAKHDVLDYLNRVLDSKYYYAICKADKNCLNDILEWAVYFCVKNKLLNTLYYCFRIKAIIKAVKTRQ